MTTATRSPGKTRVSRAQSARGALAGHLLAALIGCAPTLLPMLGAAFISVPMIYGLVLLATLPVAFLVAVPAFVIARVRQWPAAVGPLLVSATGVLCWASAQWLSGALPATMQVPAPLSIMVAVSVGLFGGPLALVFEKSRMHSIWALAVLLAVGAAGWGIVLAQFAAAV